MIVLNMINLFFKQYSSKNNTLRRRSEHLGSILEPCPLGNQGEIWSLHAS